MHRRRLWIRREGLIVVHAWRRADPWWYRRIRSASPLLELCSLDEVSQCQKIVQRHQPGSQLGRKLNCNISIFVTCLRRDGISDKKHGANLGDPGIGALPASSVRRRPSRRIPCGPATSKHGVYWLRAAEVPLYAPAASLYQNSAIVLCQCVAAVSVTAATLRDPSR